MKVPSAESALVTVDIPDSWNPEEITDGVAGESEGDILNILAADKRKGADSDLADSLTMLKELDVELDQSSKKVKKVKLNGLDAEEMLFQGKEVFSRHTTPVLVTFVVLPIKGRVVVLTHYVPTEDAKKSKEAVEKIIQSLKPVENEASAGKAKKPAVEQLAQSGFHLIPQNPENLIGRWKGIGREISLTVDVTFTDEGVFQMLKGRADEVGIWIHGPYTVDNSSWPMKITVLDGDQKQKRYFAAAIIDHQNKMDLQEIESPDDPLNADDASHLLRQR